jgi:hypothetical protein
MSYAGGVFKIKGDRGDRGLKGDRGDPGIVPYNIICVEGIARFNGNTADLFIKFQKASSKDFIMYLPCNDELERHFPHFNHIDTEEENGYKCVIRTPRDVDGEYVISILVFKNVELFKNDNYMMIGYEILK